MSKKKYKGYKIHPLDGKPTVVNRISLECFRHEDVCDEQCEDCLFDVAGGAEKRAVFEEWEAENG